MRRLFADRRTRRYLIGQISSTVGDSALWLTLSIWVKVLTGSTSAAGWSIFALILGTTTAPLGGLLVDRVRRRPMLIVVNLVMALTVCALLAVQGRDRVWLIYVVMFAYGVAAAIIGSGQTALLPAIVGADQLGAANGALQTFGQGSRLVTPLLGAGLFAAFGARPMIVLDAVTFGIAAASLALIRVDEPRPVPSGEPWRSDVSAGARHLRRTPELAALTIAGCLSMIAIGLSETVSYAIVTDGLHRQPTFLGPLLSAQGVGAIGAGAVASRALKRIGELRLVATALACCAAGFALCIVPELGAVVSGVVLIGVSLSWIVVGLITALQRLTPSALLGRADAALGFLLTIPQTGAIALGSILIAVIDFRILLTAMSLVLVVATAYLATRSDQRIAAETSTVA